MLSLETMAFFGIHGVRRPAPSWCDKMGVSSHRLLSSKVPVQKRESFSYPTFPMQDPELSHIGLALMKPEVIQIRYRTNYSAVELDNRSEGQVGVKCPSWSLGVVVRQDGANLQEPSN